MVICVFILLTYATLVASWFPNYYPAYCSKDMSQRQIIPLSTSQQSLVNELKQVQVIVRHGARTPYALFSCWANYTVTWTNCNVTELMIPSPSYNLPTRPAKWLFRKIYDGSPNELGGNCYTGQLLLEGYEQEEANGQILFQAYLNSSLPLRLFDTNVWTELNTGSQMYLRSDDEQRTLESGQILLHTMFNITEEVIVLWHTGDYDLDQIYPNSGVCPRLNQLQDIAYSSSEFIAINNSAYINNLTNNLTVIFGGVSYWTWNNALDCLMTTVCTNRDIPSGSVSSGAIMDDAIFNATIDNVQWNYAYNALYNNSIWSKEAMGNTVWHIANNLKAALNSSSNPTNYLKFALFSGHDTTIMPLLASILGQSWDQQWAAYASMITIELYSSVTNPNDSNYDLFRLVYNGKPLLVPGCSDTLCNINILLNILSFGKEFMPCSVSDTTSSISSNSDGNCIDSGGLNKLDWSMIVIASLFMGTLIGAAVAIFLNKRMNFKENNISLLNNIPRSSDARL
eukprot:gene10653-14307_t